MSETMFTCQQMFRHACAFSDCADFAMIKFDPGKTNIEGYTTPATVNSAFACEVFLKVLLLHYYSKPAERIHKLQELYELLPEDVKEWIKHKTEINYGGRWNDGFGMERLMNISDAFRKWRYYYEDFPEKICSMQIDIGFLIAFRDTLRELCSIKLFHVEWDEYKLLN